MNCDKETGISIMKIEEELDAGPILLKSKIEITKNNNYEELSNKMSKFRSKINFRCFRSNFKKKSKFCAATTGKSYICKKNKKNGV